MGEVQERLTLFVSVSTSVVGSVMIGVSVEVDVTMAVVVISTIVLGGGMERQPQALEISEQGNC
jgi:hypothetical protein